MPRPSGRWSAPSGAGYETIQSLGLSWVDLIRPRGVVFDGWLERPSVHALFIGVSSVVSNPLDHSLSTVLDVLHHQRVEGGSGFVARVSARCIDR